MKKIIKLILPAVMIYITSYCKDENRLLPVAKIITDLQSRNEKFHDIRLFHTPESLTVEGIGNYIHYLIDSNEMHKLFHENYQSVRFILPLPASGPLNLMLTQHEILTDDFKAKLMSDGGERTTAFNHGIFYYGMIENKGRTMVALSVFNNEVACVISDQNGNWNLGPLDKGKSEYGYYNDKSFRLPMEFKCETPDTASNQGYRGPGPDITVTPVSKCVRIFFDCDNDFYIAKSSDFNEVLRYLFSIFNVESTIYANEGITVAICIVIVWDIPDPFNQGNSLDNLNDYSDWREDGSTWDAAQLLAVDAGSLGGIAFLGTVCGGYCPWPFCHYGPSSYCDIAGFYTASAFTFPTYSWDVDVAAHELGHNLGSNHTHWCGWNGGAIDNCNQCFNPVIPFEGSCTSAPNPPSTGGTIMSYCHGCSAGKDFTAGFGQQPGDAIRNFIAGAGCLTSCTSSCLTIVNVGSPVTSGNTVEFEAVYLIYGSDLVESGADVTFRSDTVILKPGFHAESGSVFRAHIAPCSSAKTFSNNGESSVSESNQLRTFQEGNSTNIVPNPFHSNFEISVNLGESENLKLVLYNSSGVKVKELMNRALTKGLSKLSFDCAELNPGVYILEIYFGESKTVKRIVKM